METKGIGEADQSCSCDLGRVKKARNRKHADGKEW